MRKIAIFTYSLIIITLALQAQPSVSLLDETDKLNVSETIEYAPTISKDGKTMILQSNRDNTFQLFESGFVHGEWTTPKAIEPINNYFDKYHVAGMPSITGDGKTIYFAALNESAKNLDIYSSSKEGDVWSKPSLVRSSVTKEDENYPSIAENGEKLYFSRKRKNEDCYEIYVSTKDGNNWSKPEILPATINDGCSKAPMLLWDNKTLVFSSNRGDGKGGYDIYRSTQDEAGSWSAPQNMDFINTPANDDYAHIKPYEEYAFITSDGDINALETPLPLRLYPPTQFSGAVNDLRSKKPTNANITVLNAFGDTLGTSPVEKSYEVHLSSGKEYKVVFFGEGYHDTSFVFNQAELNTELQKEPKDVFLRPLEQTINLNISDAETGEGLAVDIKITNLNTGEEFVIKDVVGRDGKYAVNLREGNKYNIEISSSEGYAYANEEVFIPSSSKMIAGNFRSIDDDSMAVEKPVIKMPEIKIAVQPIKEGTKLELRNIYFDFGSHKLQDSSYLELEKVVKMLEDNPKINIAIEAHTDDVGSASANLRMSQQRAQEIVNYLVKKGIKRTKLKPHGYGESQPVAPNDTEENRAKNRRVELKVIEVN